MSTAQYRAPWSSSHFGHTIDGRYAITRLIGEGGMGGVYEGEHLDLGRRVAIKLVHAIHARDPQVAERIRREARSIGAIESENIVQVLDAGEDAELGIFLVMELLKGEDLASLLARTQRVSPVVAAAMVAQAAQGLGRAHAAGIVHRDLKPANVFLCARDDGSPLVKLVDFGIAKLVRDVNQANRTPGLTQAGMAIGTPQYMSPEQVQGLSSVDHRTDVYSLGAVLYEACVGRSPYPEMPTYEQTILQIVTREPPRLRYALPQVHPELDRLCADMMAYAPEARPADMAAVRERLVRIFPEIQGGRFPMRSLVTDVAPDVVVPSGPVAPVARPRSSLSPVIDAEPIERAAAGLPRRGSGVVMAVLSGLALIGLCVLALTRMHAAARPRPTLASFHVVESTVSVPEAPSAPVLPVASAPEPAPSAAPPSVAPGAPTAPVASAPAAHAKPFHAASKPAATKRKGAPVPGSAPPVGGTSESTEF